MADSSLRTLKVKLISAVDEVRDEAITPSQAQAMASLTRTIIRLHETEELEERIEGLERGVSNE